MDKDIDLDRLVPAVTRLCTMLKAAKITCNRVGSEIIIAQLIEEIQAEIDV